MVTSAAGPCDARLADRHDPFALRHRAGRAVEDLVLQHQHGVGIADRGLEQALGVGRVGRRHHLQPRHVRVPGRVALAVLGGDARGRAVGPAEHDRAAHLPARHVERLGRRVDDLVDRLHGEVPGHELDDRPQARHGRAHADAGKPLLGDGRIDHALRPELLEQALADLVGALVLRHLLAHQEHVRRRAASPPPSRRAAPRASFASRSRCRELPLPGFFRHGERAGVRGGNRGRRSLGRPSPRPSPRVDGAWRDAGDARGEGDAAAPSPSSTAIGVLTFTPSVPAGMSSFDTLPSSEASTSMVALSVSISAMTSPALMVWPSSTSHLASLPSSMVGDSAGIRISVGISSGLLSWRGSDPSASRCS